MDCEEWRPAVGWEGFYEVSNLGRVRSVDRFVKRKDGRERRAPGRILKACTTKSGGYQAVNLQGDGKHRTSKTSQLVALAFLGPRPSSMQVRHKDGNPTNNRLDNLCYGTQSENAKDSVEHGTHNNARKIRCRRGHMLKAPNLLPSPWRNHGLRACLACSQALGLQRRGHPDIDVQAESDRYYARTKHLVEPDASP